MRQDNQIKTNSKKPSKKDAQKEVYNKLSGALAEYKSNLTEKRFQKNLKKASKLFAVDLWKSYKKNHKKTGAKKEADI